MRFETVSLGDALYIKGRIGWKGLKKDEYLDSGNYRIINAEALKDGHIDWSCCGYIDKERYDESPEIMLQPEDILISKDGTIGKVGFVDELTEPSTVASGIFVIRNIKPEQFDTRFIYHFFRSNIFKDFIQSRTEGSVIPHLYQRDFETLQFPKTGIKHQKKISMIIDSFEKKIDTLTGINDNLEALGQAKYDSLMTEILTDYEEIQLSDYGEIVGGSTPSKSFSDYYTDKGIAWLTPKDLSDNKSKFIGKGSIDITDDGLHNSSARIMPRGTILYTSRAPIGYIAIAKNDITTNQGFKSVVPKDDCYRSFIYYFLKNNFELINGLASGSTFMEVSGSMMKSVPVPLISQDQAMLFESYCNPLFNYQEELESEIVKLTSLRDYLLPKLMSGEIDVSTLEIPN